MPESHAERPLVHAVLGTSLLPPYPEGSEVGLFGMGCFWGAEKMFWEAPGVITTAVGYAGGHTEWPSYREVCSGRSGHAEVVRVVFDPRRTSYEEMLRIFWEGHDPTQGMRQGPDVGSQYRSALYTHGDRQRELAAASREAYGQRLATAGFGPITTELEPAPELWLAEEYHQQYLAKNPGGYCGHGGTGVTCPVGVVSAG